MKLSETTMAVLKNCSLFNQHIVNKPGNVIRTLTDKKTTLASFTVEDVFPCEIALHDLSGFLKVVSLFEEPDFEFSEDKIIISDANSYQEYFTSSKEDLIYDDREPKLPPSDVDFILPEETLKKVLKAAQVNGVEDIAICGESGELFLKALDKENPKRTFAIKVEGESPADFTLYLKHSKKGSRLTFLPLDYTVSASKALVIQLNATIENVEINYVVACERDSTFN